MQSTICDSPAPHGNKGVFRNPGQIALSRLATRKVESQSPALPVRREDELKADKWSMKKLIEKILPKLGLNLRHAAALEAVLSCFPSRSLVDQHGAAEVVIASNQKLATMAHMQFSTFRRHKATLTAKKILQSNTGRIGRPGNHAKPGDGAEFKFGLSLQPLLDRIPEFLELERQVDNEKSVARRRRYELKSRLGIIADDLRHSGETLPAIVAKMERDRQCIGRRIRHLDDDKRLQSLATDVENLEIEVARVLRPQVLKTSVEGAQIERRIQNSKPILELNWDVNASEPKLASVRFFRLGFATRSEEAQSAAVIVANDNQFREAGNGQIAGLDLFPDANQSTAVLITSGAPNNILADTPPSTPDQNEHGMLNVRSHKSATFYWQNYKRVCPQLGDFIFAAVNSQRDFEIEMAKLARALGIVESQVQILQRSLGVEGFHVVIAYMFWRGDRIRDARSYAANLVTKATAGRISTDHLLRSMLAANLKPVTGNSA